MGQFAGFAFLQDIVEDQKQHEENAFYRGRETEHSLTLEFRADTNEWHENQGKPKRPRDEGHDLGLVFRLLYHCMATNGFMRRVTKRPRKARDSVEFHRNNWKLLSRGEDPPWLEKSSEQKAQSLHAFLFERFHLCRRGTCMYPESPLARKGINNAAWEGLWMTDEELRQLVSEVMDAYIDANLGSD